MFFIVYSELSLEYFIMKPFLSIILFRNNFISSFCLYLKYLLVISNSLNLLIIFLTVGVILSKCKLFITNTNLSISLLHKLSKCIIDTTYPSF